MLKDEEGFSKCNLLSYSKKEGIKIRKDDEWPSHMFCAMPDQYLHTRSLMIDGLENRRIYIIYNNMALGDGRKIGLWLVSTS